MNAVARNQKEAALLRQKRAVKLGEELRESYASILNEPCPDSILKLLEQLQALESRNTKPK